MVGFSQAFNVDPEKIFIIKSARSMFFRIYVQCFFFNMREKNLDDNLDDSAEMRYIKPRNFD